MKRIVPILLIVVVSTFAKAGEDGDARAHYIANMGAMIELGDTKILFDPLFNNNFDTYDLPTDAVQEALIAGVEPWDGVDAVFISHYHEDHFDPAAILKLLRGQPDTVLFAPQQATLAIRALVGDPEDSVVERIHGLSLANGEAATDIKLGSLLVEATRVPHGGWPDRHADVENMVFRVTLDSHTTVMHFGDAEADDDLYAEQAAYWQKRLTHFAMPPYWFFLSPQGRQILEHRIAIDHAVGMHVPSQIPDRVEDRPAEVRDVDLFTRPGETRVIEVD